jgi:hypothetical protein
LSPTSPRLGSIDDVNEEMVNRVVEQALEFWIKPEPASAASKPENLSSSTYGVRELDPAWAGLRNVCPHRGSVS